MLIICYLLIIYYLLIIHGALVGCTIDISFIVLVDHIHHHHIHQLMLCTILLLL